MNTKLLIIGIGMIALSLLSAVVGPILVVLLMAYDDAAGGRFVAPGEHVVEAEAGKYVLWNEYQTLHEGTMYRKSATLPDGVVVRIYSSDPTDSHDTLPLVHSSFRSEVSVGSGSRNSVGSIEFPRAGVYRIEISQLDEERLFSLRPAGGNRVLVTLAIGGLLALALFVVGIVLVVRGARRSPPTPSRGE
ncbi:MAG: hypothetical protein AAF581_21845 [Planctomycetota bacterium]